MHWLESCIREVSILFEISGLLLCELHPRLCCMFVLRLLTLFYSLTQSAAVNITNALDSEHCRSCYPLNVRGTRSSSMIWRLHPEQYHAEARSGRCGGCAVIQQIANLVVYMMIMHQVENNTLIITFKVKN